MIKNWLVHGDCHGDFTWMTNGCLSNYNPKETAIIILGDAGLNFYLNKHDNRLKKGVNELDFRIYCVRGNHEARPQSVSAPYKLAWDPCVGGEVYIEEEYPNIRFFKDFGEYLITGYRVAVIGGAYSVDKWWRLAQAGVLKKTDWGYNNPKRTGWFPDEQLTVEEMEEATELLQGNCYDFVFSHTCPLSFQPTDLFLGAVDQSTVDTSMERWMEELKDKMTWFVWLFAHYHDDRLERPYVEMYYNDVEALDDIILRWEAYGDGAELDWWLQKSPQFYMK